MQDYNYLRPTEQLNHFKRPQRRRFEDQKKRIIEITKYPASRIQELKQNPRKKMSGRRRRRTLPDFSPCNSTNREDTNLIRTSSVTKLDENESSFCNTSTMTSYPNSEISGLKRDSSASCAGWSISSMLAIVPATPSPVCSSLSPSSLHSCSSISDIFYSDESSPFSTPRNKSPGTLSNGKKSISSIDKDEEVDFVNDQCSFYDMEGESFKQECTPKRSTAHESVNSETVNTFSNKTWMVVSEEKSDTGLSDSRHEDSENEGPLILHGHHRLMARPKPYPAFLEEIKKKEFEDKINSWKEAKQLKLKNKLRRKEEAIRAWEFKHTSKALNKMKEIERKLEKKRAYKFEQMRKKISNVQRKANEKRAREKRSAVKKMSTISRLVDKIQSTKNLIWLKFVRCW